MPTAQQSDYAPTVLDIAIDAIKTSTYGDRFKRFIYGNPEEGIMAGECPLFIGIKQEAKFVQDTTAHDLVTYDLLFRIVIDKYTFSEGASEDDVMDFRELETVTEGLLESNGRYDPNSIVGILRVGFTMNDYIVNQEINVKYGRVNNPYVNEMTREAQIHMMVQKLILVPVRR